MKFKMRHSLTSEALSDLLKLIKLHCPAPNLCCQSLYLFNKQFMESLKQPVCFHSFCSACFAAIEKVDTICPNLACSIDLDDKSKSHFIELPLEAQLSSILESKYTLADNAYRHWSLQFMSVCVFVHRLIYGLSVSIIMMSIGRTQQDLYVGGSGIITLSHCRERLP